MDEYAYALQPLDGLALPAPSDSTVTAVIGQTTSPTTVVTRYRAAQHLTHTAAERLHCITPRANHSSAQSGDTTRTWYSSRTEQQTSTSTFDETQIVADNLHIVANWQPAAEQWRQFIESYGVFLAKQTEPLVLAIDTVSGLYPWLPRLLDLVEHTPAPVSVVIAAVPSFLDVVRQPYAYATYVCYTQGTRLQSTTHGNLSLSMKEFLQQSTTCPRVVVKSDTADAECYELADAYESFALCTSIYQQTILGGSP